jgi:hypothetical protein
MSDTVRVCCGAGQAEALPAKVLEFSIRRRTEREVQFIRMDAFDHLIPPYAKKISATGFSFHRLAIPEAMGFEGKAIYCDSDQIVVGDIGELWDWEYPDADARVLQTPDWQTAVLHIDCRVPWRVSEISEKIERGEWSYGRVLNLEKIGAEKYKRACLSQVWNCHDRRKDFASMIENEEAKLIHWTSMPAQPWLKSGHSHESLWTTELVDAIREGFIEPSMIMSEIEKRHVRPSLSVYAGRFPPQYDDRDFVPPFRRKK